MVQIIQEHRKPSTSQKFSKAIGVGLEAYNKNQEGKMAEKALKDENEALKRLTGHDLSGIKDPKQRQNIVEELMRAANKEKPGADKYEREAEEKLATYNSGLETINKMRQIGKGGNLGRGSALMGFFGGQTAKDRAQYEQLGKSLISLASNIPIRNQKEFEALAHNLYDPSLPDDAREGILEAMEQIITQSMSAYGPKQAGQSPQGASGNTDKPPLSSFHR